MQNNQRWILYDLHMHSEYSAENRTRKMSAHDFVSTIMGKGVEVFSITDHNVFSEQYYEQIEAEIKDKNIKCIYGAELNVYVESGKFQAAFYFHPESNKKSISNALKKLYDNGKKPLLGDIIDELNNSGLSFIIIPEGDKSGGIKNILHKLSIEETIYMQKNAMQHIFRAYDTKHTFNKTSANMWALGFYKASNDFENLTSHLAPEEIDDLCNDLSAYIKEKSANNDTNNVNQKIKKIGDLIIEYGNSISYFHFSDWHNKEEYNPKFNNYVYGTFDLPFETLEIATLDPVSRIDVLLHGDTKETHLSFIKQLSFSIGGFIHTIDFSSGLNAIIGKRASGKSFLVSILLYLKGLESDLIQYRKTIPIEFDSIKCTTFGGNVLTKGQLSSIEYIQQSQIKEIFENPQKALEKIKENFPGLPRIDYTNYISLCNCISKLKPYNFNFKSFSSFIRLSKRFTAYSISTCKQPDFSNIIDELSNIIEAYSNLVNAMTAVGFEGRYLTDIANKIYNGSNIYIEMQKKYSSLFIFLNEEINKNNRIITERQESIRQVKNEIKEAYDVIKSDFEVLLEYKKAQLLFEHLKIEIPQIKINKKGNCLFVSNYNLSDDPKTIVLNILQDNINKRGYQVKNAFEFVKDYLFGDIKLKTGKTSIAQSLDIRTLEEHLTPSQTFYQILSSNFDLSNVKNINDLDSAVNAGALENVSKSSIGRQSILYLELLLSLDTTILLLDQPEDNVDNDYISNFFVPIIKKEKKRKQLIFVSHNPSVAVYADAFNYIYAKNDGKITYSNYFIEKNEDKIKILNILDGGEKSFANRNQKYGNIIGEFKYARNNNN